MAQLQKLFTKSKRPEAITFDMDLIRLVKVLHGFSTENKVNIIIKHLDQILVASNGRVSSTPTQVGLEDFWRVKTAAQAAVWWLQNPDKAFEALTTSLVDNSQQKNK